MPGRIPEVAVPTAVQYRHFPISMFVENAKALEASGNVDYLQTWDQLMGWWPRSLWTRENSPLVEFMPDPDAYSDVFALLAHGVAHAPNLGVMVSTDAIRRGPAELTQTMLTLAQMTNGKAMFHLGAGEVKQTKPFGWRRDEGLARLREQFEIFDRFWTSDQPFDYDGKHRTMRDAWLGRPRSMVRPELWALGGGPLLIDLAAQLADGFGFVAPGVYPTPEQFGAAVSDIKARVAAAGRDPEQFGFGVYAMTAIHEDPAVIDRGLDNPIMKWMTAIWGRLNMSDWDQVGLEPPFPRDWQYAIRLLPPQIDKAEAEDVLSRVSKAHGEHGWIRGNAVEVAATLQQYVDAGATWVGIFDFLPLILPLDDAQGALRRTLDVAAILKGQGGAA